jgi:hypothetical protein
MAMFAVTCDTFVPLNIDEDHCLIGLTLAALLINIILILEQEYESITSQ